MFPSGTRCAECLELSAETINVMRLWPVLLKGEKRGKKDVNSRGTRTKIRLGQQTGVLLACSQDRGVGGGGGAAAQGPRGGAPSLPLGVDQHFLVYVCRKEVRLERYVKNGVKMR